MSSRSKRLLGKSSVHLNIQQSGLRLTHARASARASATASTRASKSVEDDRVEVGPRGGDSWALVPVKDIDTKTTVSSTPIYLSIYLLSLDNRLLSLTIVNGRSINRKVRVDLFLRRVEGGRRGLMRTSACHRYRQQTTYSI